MASMSGSESSPSYDQYALGMRSLRATLSAFWPSREAIATISLHSPSCIPGRTLRTPIAAVLRTPHFTFLLATTSLPGLAVPFYHALPSRQNARDPTRFVLPPPIAYKNCHVSGPFDRLLRCRKFRLRRPMAVGCFRRSNRGDSSDDRLPGRRHFPFSQENHGPDSSLL